MRARRRHPRHKSAELNITAFMNLMVILVPFLLITAVFSRLTILELNIPSPDTQAQQDEQPPLQLEVVVRKDALYLQEFNTGPIKRLPWEDEEVNWQELTDVLVEIKSRFPDVDTIALLVEREIDYQRLVSVMDHVSSAEIVRAASVETVELFPGIAIGDAPVLTQEETTL